MPDMYPFVGQRKRPDFILSMVESHCVLSREIIDITRLSPNALQIIGEEEEK